LAHIVHVLKFYRPTIGGVERVAEFYADAARSAGHDVTILVSANTGEAPGRTVLENGAVLIRLRTLGNVMRMPISPALPFALLKFIFKADIIHFHEPYPHGTLWLLLLPKPYKLITTWHGDIIRQKFLKPYVEWLQDKLAARADALVTTTTRMPHSSPVLKRNPARLRVVSFMIDLAPFDALRADVDRISRTRARCGGRFVLACGRLVPYKGYDFLIDAMEGTDIRVAVVGEGYLRKALEDQARARGVERQLLFLGAVDDETLKDLFCACEFFAFPSSNQGEAFGLVQLEAMAAGRPVVNTSLPTSVPEVSLHEESGITVPPRDSEALRKAMLMLWNDTRMRERLGAGALARVTERFERGRVMHQLLDLYQEVLAAD
jgi:glycosyltransferase involved in cell wall biosynthesis